eukprot:3900083-Amphidinium_carterae.1
MWAPYAATLTGKDVMLHTDCTRAFNMKVEGSLHTCVLKPLAWRSASFVSLVKIVLVTGCMVFEVSLQAESSFEVYLEAFDSNGVLPASARHFIAFERTLETFI